MNHSPISNQLSLPDYLRPKLKLVFVGLNPGLYSARVGQYFARNTNRFWKALTASRLVGREVRAGDEKMLFKMGIGFTDIVKRASGQIDELTEEEIAAGAKTFIEKIDRYQPAVICFIGITGYRWVFEVPSKARVKPGLQQNRIGSTLVYVLPSTSPANAHYSKDKIVIEFRKLKRWLESRKITF